jgi:hypothetical protein
MGIEVQKKTCDYCPGGNGFGWGREPETGETFKVECQWCNGFGILLRDGPTAKWRKIPGIMEMSRTEAS